MKAGLLDLVDHAVERGWSARRACSVLGLEPARHTEWVQRRDAGRLDDAAPGGNPLHGILDVERAAIIELHYRWGEFDRSHRKLAHRGSREHLVHVSESTVRRVLADEELVLPGQPPREPTPRADWPEWLEWKPNRVWGYDFSHFTRARRAAVAIIDIVSRKWIGTLVLGRGIGDPGRGRVHPRPRCRGPVGCRRRPRHRRPGAIPPPMRDGLRYTQQQHDAVATLAVDIAHRHGWSGQWWLSSRLVGHEDVSPITRHTSDGGWDPGALRSEPWFDWNYVYAKIENMHTR